MTTSEILDAIQSGHADADIARISAALNDRERLLAASKAQGFQRGQTVIFNGQGNRYLAGVKATVVKVNQKSLIVDVEENPLARGFSGLRNVKAGVTLVDAAPDGTSAPTPSPAPAPSSRHEKSIYDFELGQEVVFNDSGYRYLAGVKAVVAKRNRTRLLVDVEVNPQARGFSGSKNVSVSPELIDALPSA